MMGEPLLLARPKKHRSIQPCAAARLLAASAVRPMAEHFHLLRRITCALRARRLLFPAAAPGIGTVQEKTEGLLFLALPTRPSQQLTASVALPMGRRFTVPRRLTFVLRELPAMFPVQALGIGHAQDKMEGLLLLALPTRPKYQPTASAVLPTTEHSHLLQQPTFVLPGQRLLLAVRVPGIGLVTEKTTEATLTALPIKLRHQLMASAVLPITEHFHLLRRIICALRARRLLFPAQALGIGLAMARTEAVMPIAPLTRPKYQPTASAVLPMAELFTMLRPIIYVLPELPAMSRAAVPGIGPATAMTEAVMPTVMLTKPSR